MVQATERQDERQLIKQVLDGDAEAFAPLVGRYQNAVYSLVFRIAADTETAEELTQDCFMKAYRALPRFKGECAFSTWLFRIAYNTAISAVRRQRHTHYSIDEGRLNAVSDDQADTLLAPSDDTPRIEALIRALDLLPPDERALVTLFYYDDRSINDCAEILGLSAANIKVRLHRIRKKLYILTIDELSRNQ